MESLGRRIARLRTARGMSRGALAVAVGSPSGRQLVARWENGKSDPSLKHLGALATALGVSVGELLDGAQTASEARE